MTNPDPAENPLIAVESALAHLQHDFEQLQSVVLAQQTEIESLRRELELLRSRTDRFHEPEMPPAHEERPPHY